MIQKITSQIYAAAVIAGLSDILKKIPGVSGLINKIRSKEEALDIIKTFLAGKEAGLGKVTLATFLAAVIFLVGNSYVPRNSIPKLINKARSYDWVDLGKEVMDNAGSVVDKTKEVFRADPETVNKTPIKPSFGLLKEVKKFDVTPKSDDTKETKIMKKKKEQFLDLLQQMYVDKKVDVDWTLQTSFDLSDKYKKIAPALTPAEKKNIRKLLLEYKKKKETEAIEAAKQEKNEKLRERMKTSLGNDWVDKIMKQ